MKKTIGKFLMLTALAGTISSGFAMKEDAGFEKTVEMTFQNAGNVLLAGHLALTKTDLSVELANVMNNTNLQKTLNATIENYQLSNLERKAYLPLVLAEAAKNEQGLAQFVALYNSCFFGGKDSANIDYAKIGESADVLLQDLAIIDVSNAFGLALKAVTDSWGDPEYTVEEVSGYINEASKFSEKLKIISEVIAETKNDYANEMNEFFEKVKTEINESEKTVQALKAATIQEKEKKFSDQNKEIQALKAERIEWLAEKEELSKKPIVTQPNRPQLNIGGKPSINLPNRSSSLIRPIQEQSIEKPALNVSTKPALNVPTKPALNVPTKPALNVPTKPALNVPTKPALNVPTKPELNVSTTSSRPILNLNNLPNTGRK